MKKTRVFRTREEELVIAQRAVELYLNDQEPEIWRYVLAAQDVLPPSRRRAIGGNSNIKRTMLQAFVRVRDERTKGTEMNSSRANAPASEELPQVHGSDEKLTDLEKNLADLLKGLPSVVQPLIQVVKTMVAHWAQEGIRKQQPKPESETVSTDAPKQAGASEDPDTSRPQVEVTKPSTRAPATPVASKSPKVRVPVCEFLPDQQRAIREKLEAEGIEDLQLIFRQKSQYFSMPQVSWAVVMNKISHPNFKAVREHLASYNGKTLTVKGVSQAVAELRKIASKR